MPNESANLPPYETVSRGQANYVLAVLCGVIMLNFLDRQIISILAEPIKQEMGLSDSQVGLMTGVSFALFYTTLAIPVAALADRWHRSRIIAIAIGIWSVMTILCGVATNFIQLFLARVGVGIGESGSSLGAFIALAAGGWIVDTFNWRVGFYLAGFPGLLVALIVLWTVKEPRGQVRLREALKRQPNQLTLKEALRELATKPAYWHLVMAGILIQFVSYGTAAFYGSLYVRVFDVSYSELGVKLGLMVAIAGVSGAFFGGRVGDKLDKNSPANSLLLVASTFLIATPSTFAAVNVSNVNLSIALLGVTTFAATFYYGPNFSLIQTLASDRTRAMAVAIYLLFSGLFGLSLGPVFVGAVSDYISAGNPTLEADGIRGGVAMISIFNLWTAIHFWRARSHVRKTAAVQQPNAL